MISVWLLLDLLLVLLQDQVCQQQHRSLLSVAHTPFTEDHATYLLDAFDKLSELHYSGCKNRCSIQQLQSDIVYLDVQHQDLITDTANNTSPAALPITNIEMNTLLHSIGYEKAKLKLFAQIKKVTEQQASVARDKAMYLQDLQQAQLLESRLNFGVVDSGVSFLQARALGSDIADNTYTDTNRHTNAHNTSHINTLAIACCNLI